MKKIPLPLREKAIQNFQHIYRGRKFLEIYRILHENGTV